MIACLHMLTFVIPSMNMKMYTQKAYNNKKTIALVCILVPGTVQKLVLHPYFRAETHG